MHLENCFITLTYNDDNLPADRSVNVREFQLFMKRLRKRHGPGIRFFHCGEYGEEFQRPHYHACLFGHDFFDKELWRVRDGVSLYVSRELERLWPFGFSSIGDVTFNSAAYVARYIMKKVTGPLSEDHYEFVDPETGEIFQRRPEYTTMSRRPGIGSTWIQKYHSDAYPGDFVIMNGKKIKPPKAYDKWFEHEYPSDFRKLRAKRLANAKEHSDNNTPERLRVRKTVQEARLKLLPRNLK